ncbi:hypothetical protein [Tateyamaria sp. Alg231-49]|uniref:hypothetical protein n=1 Tax=Tateyamaria sp. Alg231-49 TaxID=1922219 RepID=UPI000D55D9E4|nr:hypothetical protein [Tateyamaria sp. Alg231-49]
MHFDLAHAIVTVALLFATLFVLKKVGVITEGEERKFSWTAVIAMAIVVFILNLIWPYGP